MMKNYIILGVLLFSVFVFTGCEELDTGGVSETYSLDLKEGTNLIVQLGDEYSDPGYAATYSGKDISGDIVVAGDEVDPNTVGLYKVKYVYTLENGETISRTREVIVCDKSVKVEISGKYVTIDPTHRIREGVETKYKGQTIYIKKIAPGFFEISDYLGGFYSQHYGYGNAYTTGGYVQVKSDNTITLLTANNTPWGIPASNFKKGVYDPETSTIYWEVGFAGMGFFVKLKLEE